MKKVVFGLAKSAADADRMVSALQRAGFRNDEISVLLSEEKGAVHFREGTDVGEFEGPSTTSRKKGSLGTEKHTKAPEGGVTGATAGGIIGGSIGLLLGVGSLAIPGLGIFIAAGPIVAALSGSAVGGAVGLLLGTLVGMGIPEYEAKKYEDNLKNGGVLLCVHAKNSDQIETAKNILKKERATDISTSHEKAGTR